MSIPRLLAGNITGVHPIGFGRPLAYVEYGSACDVERAKGDKHRSTRDRPVKAAELQDPSLPVVRPPSRRPETGDEEKRPSAAAFARELGLVLLVTLMYFLTRGFVRGRQSDAFNHARDTLALEQKLHMAVGSLKPPG